MSSESAFESRIEALARELGPRGQSDALVAMERHAIPF